MRAKTFFGENMKGDNDAVYNQALIQFKAWMFDKKGLLKGVSKERERKR